MTKTKKIMFIATLATLLIFILAAIGFTLADINTAPEELTSYTETGSDGSEVYAVSIGDISGVNVVKALNYVDDEFTQTGGYIANTGSGRTTRGTIKIFLKNLDPNDGDFAEKAAALDNFSDGNLWKVTLYLPAVFTSCNVYVQYSLSAQVGAIEGYDFSQYSDKQLITETGDSTTEPLFLTLALNNHRDALSGDAVADGCIVTIHYESDLAASGIMGSVLIGEDSAVKSVANGNSIINFPIAACAILVFAMFIFISILKRSNNFVPPLVLAFGIFCYKAACYYLTVSCPVPCFSLVVRNIAIGIIALSAALSCNIKIKRVDMRLPAVAVALVCILFEFLQPYLNVYALRYTTKVLYYCLSVFVVGVQIAISLKTTRVVNTLSPVAAALYTAFLTQGSHATNFLSAANWLCVMMLILIICIGFREFVRMEITSRNYTKNLRSEVEAQTNSMRTMLEEREDLLRFVSHDMRKPVKAIDKFLSTLSQREGDGENLKTIGILQDKTQEISRSLDELARYSKISYIAEASAGFDACEVTDKIYTLLEPDCTANGIIFDYTPARVKIFAKRQSLESILTNLIVNAIEHADCTRITLAAGKKKDKCVITVSDDGNGFNDDAALFAPYGTDDGEHGLGLYICRRYAEAMNATIAAERRDGLTIFTVTLPLA